mmetsp:Transcript_8530/g.25104  ORF Transcript_8530/g.25104 Transcript_8530/m.25104 type:complete len:217 (+) Transcript_8530:453-1103(+)
MCRPRACPPPCAAFLPCAPCLWAHPCGSLRTLWHACAHPGTVVVTHIVIGRRHCLRAHQPAPRNSLRTCLRHRRIRPPSSTLSTWASSAAAQCRSTLFRHTNASSPLQRRLAPPFLRSLRLSAPASPAPPRTCATGTGTTLTTSTKPTRPRLPQHLPSRLRSQLHPDHHHHLRHLGPSLPSRLPRVHPRPHPRPRGWAGASATWALSAAPPTRVCK